MHSVPDEGSPLTWRDALVSACAVLLILAIIFGSALQ